MRILSIISEIAKTKTAQPQLLRLLITEIKHSSDKHFNLTELIAYLEEHSSDCIALSSYIKRVFDHKEVLQIFTESGIYQKTGFSAEIIRKFKHSIIPELPDKKSFIHPLLFILPDRNDDYWLNHVEINDLIKFFDLLNIKIDLSQEELHDQLIEAIQILSYRITATALESEFIHTFKHNQTLDAFIKQNKQVHTLIAQLSLGISSNPHLVVYVKQLLDDALLNIKSLKKLSSNNGASLQLTFTLHRLTLQIERLKLLFDLHNTPQLDSATLIKYLKRIVSNEKNKNRIGRQLSETTYLLAYQIAEHESKVGDHYIANDASEYNTMFSSSCRGGVIAAIMTFLKVLLHHLPFAPFWHAISYSINYAAGFVVIQLSHSTLATKQPAMTASKIAHSLDNKNSAQPTIKGLALMIGKVSRSQFISFSGNLLLVFPLAFIFAWLYSLATGHLLVDRVQAKQLLYGVHPYLNLTWFYACITGVFLFLSGIISGYYDNKVIYSKIPERIREHKALRNLLPKRALIRFSKYIENNLGSLIGNISLGFMLGTASFFGFIFGIPFDIRHITISSGNYSIAMFTLINEIEWQFAVTCLIGVLGIGFFNFLVSFGLALFVAIKSRRINSKQIAELLKWTTIYFRKHPRDFFFAPKEERIIEDLS